MRRQRVAEDRHLLLDQGGQRVQRSVFECYITPANYGRLQTQLRRLMDEATDNLRFYQLCEHCRPKTALLGTAAPIDKPGLRIL